MSCQCVPTEPIFCLPRRRLRHRNRMHSQRQQTGGTSGTAVKACASVCSGGQGIGEQTNWIVIKVFMRQFA